MEKKPAEVKKTFRAGAVQASIFINEIESNGQTIKIPKVSVQKGYKDKDGEWRNGNSYDLNDLPRLALVAEKAFDYLASKAKEQ